MTIDSDYRPRKVAALSAKERAWRLRALATFGDTMRDVQKSFPKLNVWMEPATFCITVVGPHTLGTDSIGLGTGLDSFDGTADVVLDFDNTSGPWFAEVYDAEGAMLDNDHPVVQAATPAAALRKVLAFHARARSAYTHRSLTY